MPPLIRSKNAEGKTVIAIVAKGFEISEPRLSTCGRISVSPADYGLSDAQADELDRLNRLLEQTTEAMYDTAIAQVARALDVKTRRMANLFFAEPESREPMRQQLASYILAEQRNRKQQSDDSSPDPQHAAAGEIVVTWDERRTRILAVTRQDPEGHILSVIAQAPSGNDQYLLIMEGDVEPVLQGPFRTDEERLARAQAQRAKSDEDGVYRIDVSAGASIDVTAFTGAEIEDDELTGSLINDLIHGNGGICRLKIAGGIDEFMFQWCGDEIIVSQQMASKLARAVGSDLVIVDSMTCETLMTRKRAEETQAKEDWPVHAKAT